MYKVYILESTKDQSKYVGVTQDLVKRLHEHNSGETQTTKSKAPYKLLWCCGFRDKDKAYSFEKYLKSSSGFAFRNKHLI